MTRLRGPAGRPLTIVGLCGLLCACGWGAQPSAAAATWIPCADVETADVNGKAVKAVEIEVSEVDCQLADQVVRGFYAQPIGSSGAAYVDGFGCAYRVEATVECGPGASGDDGPQRIRWREQSDASKKKLVSRTCGTLPGEGAYSYIRARGITCRQAGKIAYRVRKKFCAHHDGCRQGPPLTRIRTYRGAISYRGWRCHVVQSWELDTVRCRRGQRSFFKKSAA